MYRFLTIASIFLCIATLSAATLNGADLDPKNIKITLPQDVKWKSGNGNESYVIIGDPSKPGELYIMFEKWLPHHNSRPHSHPNDRYITVVQGTWWVQTGTHYDPADLKPLPQGTTVTHFANTVHYDGAKDEPCILLVVGYGPTRAPRPQAEAK